jgi:hypothetical protein
VIVVEQANKPTTNSPDVAVKLPPAPLMEFEVADIKPVDPNRRTGSIQIGVLPGGCVKGQTGLGRNHSTITKGCRTNCHLLDNHCREKKRCFEVRGKTRV